MKRYFSLNRYILYISKVFRKDKAYKKQLIKLALEKDSWARKINGREVIFEEGKITATYRYGDYYFTIMKEWCSA